MRAEVELQWGCRPGPAERGIQTKNNYDLKVLLQWGCRPGPAESGSTSARGGAEACPRFNGAADRGRQRETATGAVVAAFNDQWLQWGCRPGPAERQKRWTDREEIIWLQWGCRPGPAERPLGAAVRRVRSHSASPLQWGCRPGPAESPSVRKRPAGKRDLQWGCRPGPAERRERLAADGRDRGVHGLQWGCRPGPAERMPAPRRTGARARCFNGAADRGRQRGPCRRRRPRSAVEAPSMGLPTGAGREEPRRAARAPDRPRFNGAADRGRQRGSRPTRLSPPWPRRCFNGAADRGRQRALRRVADPLPHVPGASMGLPTWAGREIRVLDMHAPSSRTLTSMGLPTGAGREAGAPSYRGASTDMLGASMGLPTGAGREGRHADVRSRARCRLQWGCRPGPAESVMAPAPTPWELQWGCRPGPAERRWRRGWRRWRSPLQWGCRPGPAESSQSRRRAGSTGWKLQWGCRPGPAERDMRQASGTRFNGAADRGRQRGPPGAARATRDHTCFNGAADRGRQRALQSYQGFRALTIRFARASSFGPGDTANARRIGRRLALKS